MTLEEINLRLEAVRGLIARYGRLPQLAVEESLLVLELERIHESRVVGRGEIC